MRQAVALMVASGFAGLGYQIVWTQQGGLWLGHESAAVLAVVTAFFGGLALGARALARRIEASARPARWYAACEAVTGAWGLVLALALPQIAEVLLAVTGHDPSPPWQAAVAFGGTFLALLPATAAMGATLPAMERMLRRHGAASALGGLYAANTAGAVVGVLLAAGVLVPTIGLTRTTIVCAAMNLLCALIAWRLGDPVESPGAAPAQNGATASPVPRGLLFATGLLGIGYEVLVVRVLGQVTEDTVYSFALLLAVYLVGTACGAAAWQRASRHGDAGVRRRRLLLAQAVACAIGVAGLWAAEGLRDAVAAAMGGQLPGALTAEAALAAAAFLLPTAVMGALFSELAAARVAEGIGLGRALAANLLGAALAPLIFGVLLASSIGPGAALAVVILGYAALAAVGSGRRWAVPALASAAALAVPWWPPLAFVDVPEGGRIVSYRDGALGAVSVVADAQGVLRLRINNRQQEGSSITGWADGRQAWLPLLLAPAPQRALFLGLGTGLTASAAAADPALRVEAAELLPEVIAASALFRPAHDDAPRVHAVAADARRFVRTATERYDLIVADNFHPARSGSGALYTVEHFRAVRQRLSQQGLFCQWLPLHQLDLDTLRSIVRSFLVAFPDGGAVLATHSLETPVLGLVARADGARHRADVVAARLADQTRSALARDLGFDDPYAVLGSFVAGPTALARFAGDAPANTDDRPVVAYRAPRLTYDADSSPRERLFALLPQLGIASNELFEAAPEVRERLAAYHAARDAFLFAGRDVRPTTDPRAMLAQVREPLLAVLRTSPDFRPAYDPLLRIALAVGREDPATGRALLADLQHLQPARHEAAEALARLSSAGP